MWVLSNMSYLYIRYSSRLIFLCLQLIFCICECISIISVVLWKLLVCITWDHSMFPSLRKCLIRNTVEVCYINKSVIHTYATVYWRLSLLRHYPVYISDQPWILVNVTHLLLNNNNIYLQGVRRMHVLYSIYHTWG